MFGIAGSSHGEDCRTHWGYCLKQVLTFPCRLWETLHGHWAGLLGNWGKGAEGFLEGLDELHGRIIMLDREEVKKELSKRLRQC